jgi:hypothetical protein
MNQKEYAVLWTLSHNLAYKYIKTWAANLQFTSLTMENVELFPKRITFWKVTVLLYSMLPIPETALLVWKVPRNHPFVLVQALCRWRWVLSVIGMRGGGEDRSTQRKPVPMSLSPPKISWTDSGSIRASVVRTRRVIFWNMAWPERNLSMLWCMEGFILQFLPYREQSRSPLQRPIYLCTFRWIMFVLTKIMRKLNTLCDRVC